MFKIKKNLRNILILGGFGFFALLNAGFIGGIFKITLNPLNVFGYGGGGGTSMTKDSCPHGDFSPSYYDGTCGIGSYQATGANTGTTGSIVGFIYSNDRNKAYLYARNIGITSASTRQQANLDDYLIRENAAKMIDTFAINVLGLQPDTSLPCTFNDLGSTSIDHQGYIKEACQLGLMGIGTTKFNPDEYITRAEFGVTLSRALRGNKHNGGSPYYANHLQALHDAGIMNNITNPRMLELRGNVMLMLMRAKK